MLDEKGYFYIIDAILAVMLLLMVFLIVNATISIPSPDYSHDSKDIRIAQDTMEILSGKVNFEDQSFLGEISEILKGNENSKESVREVSKICKDKLKSFNLKKKYNLCCYLILFSPGGVVWITHGTADPIPRVQIPARALYFP